jgi:hypothetical protein
MSYDLSISAPAPDCLVRKAELLRRLEQFGWQADSENHLVLRKSTGICADMDLVWKEAEDCREPEDVVNCIQVHIPYAYVESVQDKVLNRCRKVAAALNWRIYDEQTGEFLR